jgi:hypothetical protein
VAPLAGLKTGVIGSLTPGLCTPGMDRLEARGVAGRLVEVAYSSQNVPVEVADTLGPLREIGAPLMRDVGATLSGRGSSKEASMVGRVVFGDMGPPEATDCPQTVPIG